MPKFASKCDNSPAVTPTIDQPRAKLASAIQECEQARQAVLDTREAEARARELCYAAQHHADHLRGEVDKAKSADDKIVAAIAGGVDDILALERPATEIHEAIALADQKAAAWRRAANLAEQAIPVREKALAEADTHVKQCASAVLASEIDIEKLLEDALVAADWLVNRRAVLLHLASILPRDDGRRAAIDAFLGRAWLMPEIDGTFANNPALIPYAQALAALLADASAPIDIAP